MARLRSGDRPKLYVNLLRDAEWKHHTGGFPYGQKESHPGRKCLPRENPEAAADGKHCQRSKILRTNLGDAAVLVPRNRKGKFEPQVLKRNQNSIIHQQHNSSKYVSYKDIKQLMADLKAVYAAADEPAALSALDDFEAAWGKKYPRIAASWRANWANLSTYFKFPDAVRRLIYTTNAIEGFNRQLRKVTKSKSVFPTDDSLLKMLYLAMMDITKKWTGRRMDWSLIHAQLTIYYEDRMPELHKIL